LHNFEGVLLIPNIDVSRSDNTKLTAFKAADTEFLVDEWLIKTDGVDGLSFRDEMLAKKEKICEYEE
jgi:hypothetical protein